MATEKKLHIREATEADVPVIIDMVRHLAEYEKRPEDATANEEDMRYWMFERHLAEALIAEWEGEVAAYALYYPVFNSFSAEGCLHIEDIVVRTEHRGSGIGKILMKKIAALADERGYDSMDWGCLDWNEEAMGFYESMGAKRTLSIVDFEFDGETMKKVADEYRREEAE